MRVATLVRRLQACVVTMEEPAREKPIRHTRNRFRALRWLMFRRLRHYRLGIDLDFFPGRKWVRHASRETLVADARAGTNVALLAFPQSIAYALVAGVPAQFGVISAAIGGLFGPLFTGGRFVVLGPTNATAILVFSGLASAGVTEADRLVAVPLFILLVGLFQIAGALARLSVLFSYVSRTVVTGYIAAAAALIMVNQVQNALGFHITGEGTFLGVLVATIRHLGETRLPELTIAGATFATHLALRRYLPRLPGVAFTLVFMALVAAAIERTGFTLSYLGGFSLEEIGLLGLRLDFDLIGRLAIPAMAVAFVAVLEASSIGKTLASRAGERLDVNQEMYGAGATNVLSALCGGLDTSGSLTRSALSAASGARTPLASWFSGLFVLVLLLSFGFLIRFIPRAALAVVVMTIAWSLFNKHHLRTALRTTGSDAIAFFATFGSALIFTLDAAIFIGAFTSIVLFLRKAGVPELVEYNFNEAGQLAEVSDRSRSDTPGISILHAEGDLFFGSTEIFVDQTRQITKDPSIRVIILRLKNARNLDATCVLAIEELLEFLRQQGRDMVVSGADAHIRQAFANSSLLSKLGSRNFFLEVPGNPTASTRLALKRAIEIVGKRDAEIRIFVDATKKAREARGEGAPA